MGGYRPRTGAVEWQRSPRAAFRRLCVTAKFWRSHATAMGTYGWGRPRGPCGCQRRVTLRKWSGVERGRMVSSLFEDREGNLWIGGTQGIEQYRDSVSLDLLSVDARDLGNSGPLYIDGTGPAWFGPSAGGLFYLNNGRPVEVTAGGLNRDVVYSIAGGPGEIWVGRQRGGLTRLRSDGWSIAAQTFTAAQGLAPGQIFTVHRNRDGTVWAGSLGGGVSRLQNGSLKTYTTASGLASNTVSAIEDGADGTTWIATAGGLNSFAHDRWRTYTSQQGIPPGHIDCLSEDSGGVLWIGTESGLAFLRNGQVQMAPEHSRFAARGNLGHSGRWSQLALDRDVQARCAGFAAHVLGDLSGMAPVREFGPADGIPSPEGVRRDRSVVKDAEGRIWLSLRRSISVTDPARTAGESVPAMIQIQSVSADGNPLAPKPAENFRQKPANPLSISRFEPFRARPRAVSISAGWLRPWLERTHGGARNGLHQPGPRILYAACDRQQ